jgi:pimeloyl-ACP methyl ester carboxylesterase
MAIQILEAQFDKDGNVFQPQQEADALRFLSTAPGNQTTDVVVLSHGWNDDMDEARTLYRKFLANLEALLPLSRAAKVIAIGVLWPSKKFAEKDLIPGGAAGFDPFEVFSPLLAAQVEQFKRALGSADADAQIDAAAALLPQLENSEAAQREFVSKLGAILQPHVDPAQVSFEEGTPSFATQDGAELLQKLSAPVVETGTADPTGGGAASLDDSSGGAAALGGLFSSITAGASRLLNCVTYYVMKDRAGLVGRVGVNPMLSRIQAGVSPGIRFHLVGHSFGGRLMTAAVDGPNPLRVNTLLLLQAAFSHNGFAQQYDGQHDGFFLNVIRQRKVSGPILVTHSDKDEAVGLAYPLASRIAQDTAAAMGDASDVFGGIGRNGAQHMGGLAQELTLLAAQSPYQLAAGKLISNFNGDQVITGHSDVARPETAWLLAMRILS